MYYQNDFNNPVSDMTTYICYIDESLEEDEIMVTPAIYSELQRLKEESGVSINNNDYFEVVISNYGFDQQTGDEPLTLSNLKVIDKQTTLPDKYICVSSEYLKKVKEDQVFRYAYIIVDKEYAADINNVLSDSYFYSEANLYSSLYSLIDITNIFSSIFFIVVIVLILILTIIVLSHNLRVIKHERYRIGIYKALGCSDNVINIAILIYSITTVLIIFIISIISTLFTSYLADGLLRFGFCKFMNSNIYNEVTLLNFNFLYVLIFNSAIFIFTVISSFIPFMKIKRIKPNEILRKVDE